MLAHCQACTAVQKLVTIHCHSPLSQLAVPQIAKNNVKVAPDEQLQLQGFMIGVPQILQPLLQPSVCSLCDDVGLALLLLQCEGWRQTAQLPHGAACCRQPLDRCRH